LPGTEIGVTEPPPHVLDCFGAPVSSVKCPRCNAGMLGQKVLDGTTRPSGSSTRGGPAGRSARRKRMPIAATRGLLAAALSGNSTMSSTAPTPSSLRGAVSCRASKLRLLDPRFDVEATRTLKTRSREELAGMCTATPRRFDIPDRRRRRRASCPRSPSTSRGLLSLLPPRRPHEHAR